MIIGSRVRKAVASAKWSPFRVAQQLGISEQYLDCIMSNKTAVSAYVAVRLEAVLGIDAHKLMIDQALDELRTARIEYQGETEREAA